MIPSAWVGKREFALNFGFERQFAADLDTALTLLAAVNYYGTRQALGPDWCSALDRLERRYESLDGVDE
ncbi:hypothetical protein P0E39_14055 [Enterococcus faecalis]|uniref:hypothetical protein n=1 Tax=Enterococcus faecalis TaxID=1351 RepID=UPI0025AF434D|nr:hypothetical protein [Enterococcus faecalis]MDN3095856.1 hypothetical protein [Enterococcus faecalis]